MAYKFDQLIVTDIDGTIVSPPGVLSSMRTTDDRASSKRLRVLVQQANREGIGISFATGRHLRECMKLAALLNVSGPGIFDGGRTLADTSTGRVLAVENLDPTAVRHIRDILKP